MDFIIWKIDPILLSFGGLKLHWYGVFFAVAIISGFQIMKWIHQQEGKSIESLDGLLMYAVAGIIIGARLGHCLFYDPVFYLNNPLKILSIWEGGLASHGGGVGVIFAIYFYHKKSNEDYLWLIDRLAIPTALVGFFIRIGNFFNSEIIGIHTNVPWAIIFERVDALPRHPVQLYEAFSYLTIFAFLMLAYRFSNIRHHTGSILGLLLLLVFSARFFLEYLKVKQAAYSSELIMTTGQLLSIPFLVFGLLLIIMAVVKYRRKVGF